MAINPVLTHRYLNQIFATLTVHILTTSHGIGIGWLSPTLQKLQSPESPLDFPVTVTDISWIGSLFGLGSLSGNIFFGLLLDRVGRKKCMYMLAIPHMSFWILSYYAKCVAYLYVARFCGGVTAGGIYIIIAIYISEIADPNIRGALSSMSMLAVTFGILLGFLLSSQLDYFLIPCIIIVLPLVYMMLRHIFPETPQYLLKVGKVSEAESSYKFYKNMRKQVDSSPEQDLEKCPAYEEMMKNLMNEGITEPVKFKDFYNKKAAMAILTSVVVIVLNQFSGSFAFVNYMTHIFVLSGTTMDPNLCTIIIGVVQIVGTCLATILIDRFGRKILVITSACGMALGMIAFGGFLEWASPEDLKTLNWMPMALMICVILLASIGVVSVPFVIIVEILPTKIRSVGTSFCMGINSCVIFTALKLFPIFMYGIGLPMTMFLCAGVCVLSVIYLSIFLEETKGKSMDHD